jgi:hypothetical protein
MDFDSFDEDDGVKQEYGEDGGLNEEMERDLFSLNPDESEERLPSKDAVIFLVDCHKDIFEVLPGDTKVTKPS